MALDPGRCHAPAATGGCRLPSRLRLSTIGKVAHDTTSPGAIRILPPKFVPMSGEEFDEVTDLLAELILEKLRENRPDR